MAKRYHTLAYQILILASKNNFAEPRNLLQIVHHGLEILGKISARLPLYLCIVIDCQHIF